MPWGTDKRMMELFELGDRKGFDVVKSTMKDHVCLIGPNDSQLRTARAGLPPATPRRGGIWKGCRTRGCSSAHLATAKSGN